MQVKDLIKVLQKCDGEMEVTFIFDNDERLSWDRNDGLFETTIVNVTGKQINGKVALTNGKSAKLLKGDEPSIFIK